MIFTYCKRGVPVFARISTDVSNKVALLMIAPGFPPGATKPAKLNF